MGATYKNDNVIEERNCTTLGKIDIYKKINSDNRTREWDFLKGCWRDKPTTKGGWDMRFN